MQIFAQKINEMVESVVKNVSATAAKSTSKPSADNTPAEDSQKNVVSFEKFKEPIKKALFSIPIFDDVEDNSTKKKKDFDDVWTIYRDAENTPASVSTIDQLKSAIGVDGNWKLNKPIELFFTTKTHANNTESLVKTLQKNDLLTPQVMSDMAVISKTHGTGALDVISNDLNKYLSSYSSPGEKPKQVVVNALHDIAYPSDIDQKGKDTCAGASTQMKVAMEKPFMYVEILTSLAKGEKYTLPSGKKLEPNNTWVGDKTDTRNYSARILQNAFVELGNDDFDSTKGKDKTGNHGLTKGEQRYVLEKVFNNSDFDNDTKGLMTDGSDLYQYLEDDIARGRSVQVSFEGHSVLAVGIDKSKSEHQVIINSWGSQYSMSVSDFQKHVKGVRSIDDSGSDNKKISGSKVILGDR